MDSSVKSAVKLEHVARAMAHAQLTALHFQQHTR